MDHKEKETMSFTYRGLKAELSKHPVTGEEMNFTCPPPADFPHAMLALERGTRRVILTGMPGCGKSSVGAIIADKLGRKKTIVGASVLSIIGFILFAVGINKLWNPYLIGGFCGLYQGTYWIGRDYMNVMMTEKVPTDIRASVVGAEGLLVIIGLVVAMLLGKVKRMPLSCQPLSPSV